MTRRARFLGVVWLALAAAGTTLPGCGLKRRHRCTATASYAGRTATGKGDDFDDEARARAAARQNLCTGYCDEQDPVVDGAVRTRLGRPPKDHVERINTARNPPVKSLYDACLAACNAATASVPVQYRCERSGLF